MRKIPALTLSLIVTGLLASPSLAQNRGSRPVFEAGIVHPRNPVVTAPARTPQPPTTPTTPPNGGGDKSGSANTTTNSGPRNSDPAGRFPQYPGPNAPLPDPYSSQYGNYYDPYNPYNPYGYYNSQGMYDNSSSPLINGPGYGPNYYNSGLNTGTYNNGYPSVESYNTSRRRR